MSEQPIEPRCLDCLTTDVAVKVIDQFGFEHWFCAADWQGEEDFRAAIDKMFAAAIAQMEASCSER